LNYWPIFSFKFPRISSGTDSRRFLLPTPQDNCFILRNPKHIRWQWKTRLFVYCTISRRNSHDVLRNSC